MDKIDVLKRSLLILQSAPLPEEDAEHGPYCPFCAIAVAKTQLDQEEGTTLSHMEVLIQTFIGVIEFPGDKPLLEAKKSINKVIDVNLSYFDSKELSLKILKEAINT
jgi:hydrogenase maturation factor